MIRWEDFEREFKAVGFDPKQHHATHWAVQGDCLVNYYPTSGAVFVDGMRKDKKHYGGRHCVSTIEEIMDIAVDDRPDVPGYYWPERPTYYYPR